MGLEEFMEQTLASRRESKTRRSYTRAYTIR